MEQGAKKKVLLSEKVYSKLKIEKPRPKSATLKDVQSHVLPKLEEHFKKFWDVSKPCNSQSKANEILKFVC